MSTDALEEGEGAPERVRVTVGDTTLPAFDVQRFKPGELTPEHATVAIAVEPTDMVAPRFLQVDRAVPLAVDRPEGPTMRARFERVQFEERHVTLWFREVDDDREVDLPEEPGPVCSAGRDRERFTYREVDHE